MHIDEALPEVGPESGGDFPYDEHTIDRRWSRLRSSMRIFEHVANEDVRGTKISKTTIHFNTYLLITTISLQIVPLLI